LVISLTKGVIKRIVNKVNDAKEACERLDEWKRRRQNYWGGRL
jgi:hypothetical protein